MFPMDAMESHTPISSSIRKKGNQKWQALRRFLWDIGQSRQESSHCWRHSQDLCAGDHCWSVATPSSNRCAYHTGSGREATQFFRNHPGSVLLAVFPFSFCFQEWNNLAYAFLSLSRGWNPTCHLKNPTPVQESRGILVLVERLL